MQSGGHLERLAKFVSELWAQRRQVVETRSRVDKRFAGGNDWFVRKDTELPSGYRKAQGIRATTSVETRPDERVLGLAQVICSTELQQITLSAIQ